MKRTLRSGCYSGMWKFCRVTGITVSFTMASQESNAIRFSQLFALTSHFSDNLQKPIVYGIRKGLLRMSQIGQKLNTTAGARQRTVFVNSARYLKTVARLKNLLPVDT